MALNKTKTKQSASKTKESVSSGKSLGKSKASIEEKKKSPSSSSKGSVSKKSGNNEQKKKPEEKLVQSQGVSELIVEKRKLNQEQTRWYKIDAIVSVAVCIALLFISIGVVSSKRTELFFNVDPQGRVVELTPIYLPKHSNAFVGDWLNKCLVDTFDFSYVNYKKRLTETTDLCYSPEGRKSLENALISTGNLEAVKSKRLYVSLTLDYSPVVVREMKPNAASEPYRWVLQSEGTINLQSATSNDPNNVKVTVVVSRSSMENSGRGLAIDKIILN